MKKSLEKYERGGWLKKTHESRARTVVKITMSYSEFIAFGIIPITLGLGATKKPLPS